MRADNGLRVVVDTNVWISGLLKKDGTPAHLIHWIIAEGQPVFTDSTFAELETRLWRPKFDRYLNMEIRKEFLHDLSGLARWADVPKSIAIQAFSRDIDDGKFVHAALAANAPWLVTGDHDLLELPPLPNLRILTPSDTLHLTKNQT